MASSYLLVISAAAAVVVAVAVALVKVFRFCAAWLAGRRKYNSSSLPGPPLTHPIYGHVPAIMGAKGPWSFIKWHQTYGKIYKLLFLDEHVVVLSDPATITSITRKAGQGPYLPKPRYVYAMMEVFTRPQRPNIVTSDDGDYWRAVRQAVAPCFSMSNLKQVVPLVLELTQRAADRMAQYNTFDVTDAAKRITSDVMGHLLYGEDLGGVSWGPSEYLQALYPVLKAESEMFNNPFHLWQLWDPEIRHQRRCLKRHDELMTDKLARLRKQPPAPHTIAAHILSAIDPATGKPLDDAHANHEIAIFMAAGFETTSHAITWNLTMLASHPDVQDQLYAELQDAGLAAAGDNPGRPFSASDLNRLPLLSAVIKESLRLCTPAPWGGTRHVVDEEGVELLGHHLPKGTLVILPLLPYGLAEHIYGSDALLFKPQRWMPTAAAAPVEASAQFAAPAGPETEDSSTGSAVGTCKASAAASVGSPSAAGAGDVLSGGAVGGSKVASTAAPPDPLTFMTGQRDCIGQNLARLELQVVLATFLSRFRFSPGPELEQELKLAAATGQPVVNAVHNLAGDYITMQPLSGQMMLRLEARG